MYMRIELFISIETVLKLNMLSENLRYDKFLLNIEKLPELKGRQISNGHSDYFREA